MMQKCGIILILLICFSNAFGQEKKGDKLAEKHLYLDAIEAYEAAISKSDKSGIHYKLGQLYLTTKDYEKARTSFSKTIEDAQLPADKYLFYAKSLMSVGEMDEAIKMFKKYSNEARTDHRADLYLESCEQIKTWSNESPSWTIESVDGINTSASEFGVQPYLNGIIYTTVGSSDWVDYTAYDAIHTNYYDIFYARTNGSNTSFKPGELLSAKLTSDYHDGPAALTPDSSAIYFCQLFRSGKAEKMHLYFAEIKNGEIGSPQPFDYNNDEYSIMHPTFSDDGKMLFFASDNPAAFGGFDIFFCKKTRKYGWTAPRPVPGLVNTSGDELFPHFHNGQLYFSSDGHFGYGGLDIFQSSQKEQFKVINNLKAPLNSPRDDFSIFFTNDDHGYFSSDRAGGKGLDDIYYFNRLEVIKEDEYPTMTGTFEFKKLKQSNVELVLYDEEGNEIARTRTDEQGNFEFRNLPTDKSFKIQPIGDYEEADIYITNANGEKLVLMSSSEGSFQFRQLSTADSELMLPIEEEYPTFLTIPMKGFVYRKLKGDLNDRLEVLAYDENGKLLARTYTESDGSFEFLHLIPNAQYTIKVGTEDDVYITLVTDDQHDISDPEKVGSSEFVFKRLKSEDDTFKIVNEENVIIEIRQKEKFTLPSIYYETNSYEINAASAEQLNKLYILLKKNPHIKVIFESHTDSKGRDSYNMSLSEKRSESAVKYLVKKGISKEKLEAIGYGETKLLNNCGNESNCSDEDHALNRRTEISIVGKKISF